MSALWALIGTLIVQEPISTSVAILNAREHGISAWEIHLIFLIATSFEILIGYCITWLIQRKYPNARLLRYVRMKMQSFLSTYGKFGERFGLIIATAIFFPFSTLFAPVLNLSFAESFWYQLLTNLLLWYPLVWLPVLGIGHFKISPITAMYAVVIFSAIIGFGMQFFLKKYSSKKQ